MMAALAIMPAVFAFGIKPNAGPPLMFITLPNVFRQMPMGACSRVCSSCPWLLRVLQA